MSCPYFVSAGPEVGTGICRNCGRPQFSHGAYGNEDEFDAALRMISERTTRRSERVRLAAAFGSGMLASERHDAAYDDEAFLERVLRLADATLAALDAAEREEAPDAD